MSDKLPQAFARLVQKIDMAIETNNNEFLREARGIALCLAENVKSKNQ